MFNCYNRCCGCNFVWSHIEKECPRCFPTVIPIMINKEYLKSLNPCEDRYKHYLEHYKDWSGTLEEFLDLLELTIHDKKWVFVRSIDKSQLRLVAADFADRVLGIYESNYPNDDRPRKAIEAARSGGATAAYASDAARAAYSARAAAADAAVDAAYSARAAADAAAYAATAAYSACAAAESAAAAAAARKDEEQAQIEIMKRYAREALKEIGTDRDNKGEIGT